MSTQYPNCMAVANLADGTVHRQPLPEDLANGGDLSQLAARHESAVVITCGRLTGSFAPASCVVAVYADGERTLLNGHAGKALRACGLDALIVEGTSKSPKGLVLDQHDGVFCDLDASAETPAQRKALLLAAGRHALRNGGATPENCTTLLTGPAVFLGCAQACLVPDTGTAPRTSRAAISMAKRGLAGLCLNGQGMCQPLGLDNAARAQAKVLPVQRDNLAALLAAAKPGTTAVASIVPGRSLACFACPAPCGFWLKAGEGHVAVTAPEAVANLLEDGASADRLAQVMELAGRFGIDPLALVPLAKVEAMPATVQGCAGLAHEPAECGIAPELADAAARLGVCPFYLSRFPEMQALLEEI